MVISLPFLLLVSSLLIRICKRFVSPQHSIQGVNMHGIAVNTYLLFCSKDQNPYIIIIFILDFINNSR